MRRYTVAIDGRTFTIDVSETAADRFEVSVDGRTFEATLRADEDLPGAAIAPGIAIAEAPPRGGPRLDPAIAPVASPGAVDPVRPVSPVAPAPSGPPRRPRGGVLVAPMPGVVLEVCVGAGTAVRRADPLLVLEAMKMRNTIRAPRDARVLEVAVEAGQLVASGDVLVRFGDPPG